MSFLAPTPGRLAGLPLATILLTGALVTGSPAIAHEPDEDGFVPPAFHEYDPPSTLVVPENPRPRALYPFVDVHSHQWDMPEQDLDELVARMDEMNMAVMVNLSGRSFHRVEQPDGSFRFAVRSPDHLVRSLERVREEHPDRFLLFTNVDFEGFGTVGWTEREVRQIEADIEAGAVGLKIYKSLGMDLRDPDGIRVPVDDPRLDPIWVACGRLGVPVLIHSADPAPFWQPKDADNERLLELIERPNRIRPADEFPPWEQIVGEQLRVFEKHPETTFIAAHLAWMGNDLGRLGRELDRLPNMMTEIGAVLAELGRQPRFARAFLETYRDRVLFGKDAWTPDEYPVYFRTLETADDSFEYYRRRHAFWKLHGLDLPDDVLRAIYYRNALRLFPSIDRTLFPEEP